jgi:hypothetical protein
MEEYTTYVNECNQNGIVPISFYNFICSRIIVLPELEDEEESDSGEPEIESEEAEDPKPNTD